MSTNRFQNTIFYGIQFGLLINCVLFLVLFFTIPSLNVHWPAFNQFLSQILEPCVIQLNPPLSPGQFGLAKGFHLISLLTGSLSFLQLLYIIPTLIWAKKHQKFAFMKGIIGVGVVTALLTANCFTSVVWC